MTRIIASSPASYALYNLGYKVPHPESALGFYVFGGTLEESVRNHANKSRPLLPIGAGAEILENYARITAGTGGFDTGILDLDEYSVIAISRPIALDLSPATTRRAPILSVSTGISADDPAHGSTNGGAFQYLSYYDNADPAPDQALLTFSSGTYKADGSPTVLQRQSTFNNNSNPQPYGPAANFRALSAARGKTQGLQDMYDHTTAFAATTVNDNAGYVAQRTNNTFRVGTAVTITDSYDGTLDLALLALYAGNLARSVRQEIVSRGLEIVTARGVTPAA